MNGPLKMYALKQVVRHDIKVELPNCMYRIENIHAPRNDTGHLPPKKLDILDQNNHNIPEMAALEVRQEEILRQLSDLRKQMDGIKNNLKITHSVSAPAITTKQGPPPSLPDIVINASPTNPPYSLALMQKLWKNYIWLSIKCHVHSSVSSSSENAEQLAKTLEGFTAESHVPKVNIRLIWKNVGANPELVLSLRPIAGEANILRYLSRVSSEALNYETYSNVHEIDALLDLSYSIVKSKNKTERIGLLQLLNKSLGKSEWLGGRSQISIADLAAFSAIKQVTSPNEVNVNLGKWVQRCASYR